MTLRMCGHSDIVGKCCAGCYDVLLNENYEFKKALRMIKRPETTSLTSQEIASIALREDK